MRPGEEYSTSGKFRRLIRSTRLLPSSGTILLAAALLVACTGGRPGAELATVTPHAAVEPIAAAGEQRHPDILDVALERADDSSFTVTVTVSSPYDTPERYADAWRVLTLDGAVLAVRELTHDHAAEQPFTRSLGGVHIPPDVTAITVQGRDLAYGYGGRTVTVEIAHSDRAGRTGSPSRAAPARGLEEHVNLGLTYQQPDGNRLVQGRGGQPAGPPLDIALQGEPRWVVGLPIEGGSVWAAVLADGTVQGFRVAGSEATLVGLGVERLPPGMPPLLQVVAGVPRLAPPPPDASPLSHPLPLSDGRQVYIASNGDLVLWNGAELGRLPVDALPDARLVADERDRLLVLSGPTERYAHGVLGDALEAASVTLVETAPELRVVRVIALDAPQVIEGIAPIWADPDGDGVREILVTVSDAQQGAQVVAYDEVGRRVAAGPPIGRGGRWRHQLAVAPFGPEGALELVGVRTPHIGGIVEFYVREGEQLRIVAELPGYTSHVLGARNLDLALAADLDGDGGAELLVPNQALDTLGVLRRTPAGVEMAWALPVGSRISTNLAALSGTDGRISIGVGRQDGVLRLWLAAPAE